MDIDEEQSLMDEEREDEVIDESSEGPDTTLAASDANVTAGDTITMEEQSDMSGEIGEMVTPVKRKRGRPPLSANKKGPTPKKRGRLVTTPTIKENDNELFLCMVEGKSALQSVVSEWVDRYHSDKNAAVLELVQYFVRCCGCMAELSKSDFQYEDASMSIRSLTENFAEEGCDYPLTIPGPQFKKFKSNYAEFVIRLIEGCGDIIYDDNMLPLLVKWLIGLSDSQVRAFRHTSTLACLKLVSALVIIATSVNTEIDNTQRQCETERRKSSSRRTSGKLIKLEGSLAQLQAQSEELSEMIKNLFISVFVRRYRDARSEIRSLCIAELGAWIKDYSAHFLADQYLKYIGWTLSDKVSEVRLQALQALIPLYSTPDFAPHLELFTDRFKVRLLEMRLDREDIVASLAINLCTLLFSLDMLDPEECTTICQLVFFDNKLIARAAGKFTVSYLLSEDFMIKARQVRLSKGQRRPTDAQIHLIEIVKFLLEFPIHEHAEFLVDSLWDHAEVLKDWETIVELLTVNSNGVALTDEEEVAIIEILSCSVRKATGCSMVKDKNKQLSPKEKRAIELDKHEIGVAVIPALPQLMSKYGTDVKCVANLCDIVKHLDLEIFVEIRGQKHLEDILEQLKDLAMKHTDHDVLKEVAVAYSYLLNQEFTLYSVVDVSYSQLMEDLFTNLNDGLELIEDLPLNDFSNKEVFNVSVNLQRIATFYKQINLNKWLTNLDKLVHFVELGVDESACDLLVIPSLQCLTVHLLWSLQSLDFSKPERGQCRTIRTLTNQVISLCSDLIKLGSLNVQGEAYVLLCDLLIVFNKQLASQGDVGSLVYTADYSLQSSMCEFVMERVFADGEMEMEPTTPEEAFTLAERLHERRHLLAGYLKLVLYSGIDTSSAVNVLGQFVKHYTDLGDLIGHTLTRLRQNNPISWCDTVLLTLQRQFTQLKEEDGGTIDRTSPQWADLKDLACKLVLTAGVDPIKCRLPIVATHHEGVKYSLQREEEEEFPDRIEFLEILSEFSCRLLDIDKHGPKGIHALLVDQCANYSLTLDEAQDQWDPLAYYVTSLGIGEDETIKKRGRGTKRKSANDSTSKVSPPSKSKRASPLKEQ